MYSIIPLADRALAVAILLGIVAGYLTFVWGAFWAIERVLDLIDRRTR